MELLTIKESEKMAKIGLKYPVYKTATSQGVIGKAIQADISISVNDVKLYADDGIAESDKSFQSGTITLGVDDLSDTIQTAFLGHAASEGELTAAGTDSNPYVSIGFYGVKMVAGVRKYRAIWLPKVQFAEPSDTNATKGDTIAFATPVLEGTIMLDDSGNWKKEKTFNTEVEAIAYLQAKSGVKAQCTKPVADIASGKYDEPQTVTLTAGDDETIYYTTNGTTPSADNGDTYNLAIEIAESCALRAIAVKEGMNDSEIATYEYIITE
jgi:phi13 family phage major tail protein